MDGFIYKICDSSLWAKVEAAGIFEGAPVDFADGYIHFSTASQVAETASRHFGGRNDLILAAIDPGRLGDALKYEQSRGGDLFPHLYGSLPMSAVIWHAPLPLGSNGSHMFPDLLTGRSK